MAFLGSDLLDDSADSWLGDILGGAGVGWISSLLGGGDDGGGNSEIPGGMEFSINMPAAETMADTLAAIQKAIPGMSEAQWQEMQKYEPLRAQLALQLARRYLPKQMDLQLATSQKYQPLFQALYEKMRSSDRGADMADVLKYAPDMQKVRTASEDPAVTAMRKLLVGQVGSELAMGSRLTPAQAREVEQASRSADQARGIMGGTSSANREAVLAALQGQSLLTQRQNKANSLIANEYAQTGDPFSAILGRPSTAASAAQNAQASGLQQPTAAGTPVQGTSAAISAMGLGIQNQNATTQNSLTAQMYKNQLDAMSKWMPYLMN